MSVKFVCAAHRCTRSAHEGHRVGIIQVHRPAHRVCFSRPSTARTLVQQFGNVVGVRILSFFLDFPSPLVARAFGESQVANFHLHVTTEEMKWRRSPSYQVENGVPRYAKRASIREQRF